MSISEPTEMKDTSLKRDVLAALRYYLGTRRAILTLGGAALVGGLALNWNWLVAIGAAPILLSTLPCLIMCGFGVCMMCRSGERQSSASRDAADQTTSSATLAVGTDGKPVIANASCCGGPVVAHPAQLNQYPSVDQRRDPDA